MIRGGPDLASRRRAEPKRARARAPKFGGGRRGRQLMSQEEMMELLGMTKVHRGRDGGGSGGARGREEWIERGEGEAEQQRTDAGTGRDRKDF